MSQDNCAALLQQPATPATRRSPPARVGRPLHHQVTASELDAVQRSREAMATALGDLPARVFAAEGRSHTYRILAARRKADGPRPLDAVLLDVILLSNLGAPEADLFAIPDAVVDLIHDLHPAAVRRSIDELDVEETRCEGRENDLAMRRRVQGATSEALREEARVNRAEARVQLERARVLESLARRAESHPAAGTQTPDRAGEPTGRAISTRTDAVAAAHAPAGKMAAAAPHGNTEGRP